MVEPINLTGLSPRKAVADALHRCVLGIDSNDRALFASSCLTNENLTIVTASAKLEGWTFISESFEKVFSMVTTHVISNVRVQLTKDGADTASLTCNSVAYHMKPEDARKPEDRSYTAAGLYFLDLVKDGGDGLWKIKKWEIKTLWTTGDRSILHP
jgi:hypothetical protein